MPASLTNPIFHNDEAARLYFEAQRWPNGPFCPHCGETENVHRMEGKSHKPGMLYCRECGKKFTVTVGTVMERSHIPPAKWALAFRLMAASKKGISAHQLGRMLDITYKSAWFMAHRVREAMAPAKPEPQGGQNKVVEVDETYIGGKARNRAFRTPAPKKAVVALVERDGYIRSYHVANVTADTLRPIIVKHVSRASFLMTDESVVYPKIGREFAGHGTVNHSAEEYVRAAFYHTNTAENAFSILKRGIYGVYQHVSEAHLVRYLAEFDFRRNHRSGFGINDDARTVAAIKGAEGKRLTYRGPRSTTLA